MGCETESGLKIENFDQGNTEGKFILLGIFHWTKPYKNASLSSSQSFHLFVLVDLWTTWSYQSCILQSRSRSRSVVFFFFLYDFRLTIGAWGKNDSFTVKNNRGLGIHALFVLRVMYSIPAQETEDYIISFHPGTLASPRDTHLVSGVICEVKMSVHDGLLQGLHEARYPIAQLCWDF